MPAPPPRAGAAAAARSATMPPITISAGRRDARRLGALADRAEIARHHPLRRRGGARRSPRRGWRRAGRPRSARRRWRRGSSAPCRRRSAGRCGRARPSRGRPRCRRAWPVASTSALLTPRWVAGMPTLASAPSAEVMPGRMRNGTPAAASASASSPPRAKSVGSPPFSRSTRRPSPGELDQQPVDLGLRGRGLAAALADEMRLGAGRGAQDRRVDQRVVDDGVRLVERGEHLERQAAEAARPGAGQPDVAGLEAPAVPAPAG